VFAQNMEDSALEYWSKRLQEDPSWMQTFEDWIGNVESRLVQARCLRIVQARNILDVGCGIALDYSIYKNLGLTAIYFGVDATEEFVERAKAMHKRLCRKCSTGQPRIQVAKAQELPFPDRFFDAVTCRHLLEHVPDPEPVVKEMARVARLYVMITWFHPPGNKTKIGTGRRGWGKRRYNNYYSTRAMYALLSKNNLSVVRIRRVRHEAVWLCKKG